MEAFIYKFNGASSHHHPTFSITLSGFSTLLHCQGRKFFKLRVLIKISRREELSVNFHSQCHFTARTKGNFKFSSFQTTLYRCHYHLMKSELLIWSWSEVEKSFVLCEERKMNLLHAVNNESSVGRLDMRWWRRTTIYLASSMCKQVTFNGLA